MHSRRDLLRTGAGVAGTGLVAAFAGCTAGPFGGSGEDAERVDHVAWTYDPNAVGAVSTSATVTDVDAVLAIDGIDADGFRTDVTRTYGESLPADDVATLLTVGYTEILAGSFDAVAVLEQIGASKIDEYAEFDVYATGDGDRDGGEPTETRYATDGDLLLSSSPPALVDVDAREELELVIDTADGTATRFVDVNEDFARIHEAIDPATYVSVNGRTAASVERDGGLVANATTVRVAETESTGRFVFRYADADGIDLEEIESNLEDAVTPVDRGRNGRTVTVDFTLPTAEFL